MDQQRSTKIGRANYWVVIPITNENIRRNLQDVHEYLTTKHKAFRGDLNRSLIDLDSNALHITLFGIHANAQRLQHVKEALTHYGNEVDDRSIEIELRSLGAFSTMHENVVLFADLTKESSDRVKAMAKEVRDYVLKHITDRESNEVLEVLYDDDKGEEDLPGMWMDDPLPEIYIPHLTLMNVDPKDNRKLWLHFNENVDKNSEEEFGFKFNLLRDVRHQFSKFSFGVQTVKHLELQGGFQCLSKIPLIKKSKTTVSEVEVPATAKKIMYILRGLPGSGKSTLAQQLLTKGGVILSTDDFFLDKETGQYNFNTKSLPKAHYWNQLRAKMAVDKGVSPIIIDNTNLHAWEAKPYITYAKDNNYQVEIREPETPWKANANELAQRNTHGITLDTIQQLLAQLESYTEKEALKANPPPNYALDPKDQKKVEHSLMGSDDSQADVPKTIGSSSLRVEVTVNDGRKAVFKPVVLKTDDLETFKKQACNQLKQKYGKNCQVFTLRGLPVTSVDQMLPNMQLVISADGSSFIPMALKKTAAERRADKLQKAQAHMLEAYQGNATAPAPKMQLDLRKVPKGISTIISDFLYLGSGKDAQSLEELQQHKITHILNVADELPSSSFDHIVYAKVHLQDIPEQQLHPHFGTAFEFLESVSKEGGRVLVHCVVGKSRSPAILMAYLVKCKGMSLKDAYELVSKARSIGPNTGFLRQLMEYEHSLLSTNTLHWNDIDTGCPSIFQWLKNNDNPAKYPPTHLWWEVLTKQQFHIAPHKLEELYSEMAKAIVRQEAMKLVELRDHFKYGKLYLDVDLKTATDRWEVMELLKFFLHPIQDAVKKKLAEMEMDNNVDLRFVCTGTKGPYWVAQEPEIKFKYGFHFVWLGLLVTEQQHRQILDFVIQYFKQLERNISEGSSDPNQIPLKELCKYNEWHDIFDTSIMDNFSGLRMLYTIKSFTCKLCEKLENNIKKSNSKKAAVDRSQCPSCFGTGMLDKRVHKFLGIFNANCELDEVQTEGLVKEDTVHTIQQRIKLVSVQLPRDDLIIFPQRNAIPEKPSSSADTNAAMFYVGVMVDLQDQVKLLQMFPPPADWIPDATHHTISLEPLPPSSLVQLGDRVPLTVVAVGKSAQSYAVQIKGGVPTINKVPHITIAHSRYASAKDSNDIEEWIPTDPDKSITVWGTVQEWSKYGPKDKPATVTKLSQTQTVELKKVSTKQKYGQEKTELEVVLFLRKNKTEKYLVDQLHLKAAKHKEFLNLVQLSYSQVACDMSNEIVQECRGIVLDAKNNWKVVAFPYTKFFNYGDPLAPEIDWSTAVISEKLDGCLAILYFYANRWHVASSSSADGCGAITKDLTFAELFWDIWNNVCKYKLPTNEKLTYMFEMFTPRNPIVVKPERETIVLHGVRDNESYLEMDPHQVALDNGWEAVPVVHFGSIEELIDAAKKLNPAKHEGFVVRDAYYNRIKVKTPQYVALSHLSIKGKVSVNARHMLQIVRTNEGSEFIAYFPEYAQLHKLVQESYIKLVDNLQNILKNQGSQNDASNWTQLQVFARELPEDSKASDIKEFLKNYADLDRLYSLINLKFMEDPVSTTGEITADQALKNKKLLKQKMKAEKRQKKRNQKQPTASNRATEEEEDDEDEI